MTVVTRFAPSPTGRLHLGHAYSAMMAHDRARARGGRFVLRIEDIDRARCRDAFVDGIFEDLRWLALDWDGAPVIQSMRGDAHAAALAHLQALGTLYPCVCTRAEIAASASAPHGEVPLYPGTCRQSPSREDDPRPPRPVAWRLDTRHALRLAPGASGVREGDDIVVARKGSGVAYHLAVVVDDAAGGVTHVVRGIDLRAVTPVQNLLQRLLGLPTPDYHHHRLILGPDGRRLAKRDKGITLAELREAGTDAHALMNMLRAGVLPSGFSFGAS